MQHSSYYHTYRRVLFVLLLVCPLATGCLPAGDLASRDLSSPYLEDALNDAEWREQLESLLIIGYAENPRMASFASLNPDLLETPNLYATYGSVGILTELGIEVEGQDEVARWLNSLRNEQGAYDDPANDFPLVIETYWAVATLQNLGAEIEEPEETVAFVRSLQDSSDGLFAPDASVGGPEEEQKLFTTTYAINTLRILGTPAAESALERCKGALRDYVASQVSGLSPQIGDNETAFFMGVAGHLAKIDPTALPEEVEAFVQSVLEDVPSLPGSSMLYGVLDNLLDLVVFGELSSREAAVETIQSYVREHILPQLTDPKGIDPYLTYIAVRLAERVDVSVPHPSSLEQLLSRYRIESGWMVFVIPSPNPQATYAALGVAKLLQFDDYDPEKVAEYLKQFIRPNRERLDLMSAYYAWQGLELLEREPSEGTMETFRDAAISHLEGLIDSGDGVEYELFAFSLLARSCQWEVPDFIKEEVERVLEDFDADGPYRMRTLHLYSVLQSLLEEEPISPETIETLVFSLSTETGGFKPVLGSSVADVPATFGALRTLALLDRIDAVDLDKVKDFTLSCKDDYGFSYVSSTAREEDPESLGSDLVVTYEALQILTFEP